MADAISTINKLDPRFRAQTSVCKISLKSIQAFCRYHSSCAARKNPEVKVYRSLCSIVKLLSLLQCLRAECSKITLRQYLIEQEADTARVYRSEKQLSDFKLGAIF